MKFPRLQMLAEAKKKAKPAADEMDFDMEGGEGELDMPMDDMPASKGKKAAITKADVLSYLKGCDAKCRAEVHTKLMAMVEADEAAMSEGMHMAKSTAMKKPMSGPMAKPMSDERAAKMIFNKCKPYCMDASRASQIEPHVKKYLDMVGKSPKDVKMLTGLVWAMCQDAQ